METNVEEISARSVKRGFDVEVLTTDPTGKLPREEIISDIKVKWFRSWAPNESVLGFVWGTTLLPFDQERI